MSASKSQFAQERHHHRSRAGREPHRLRQPLLLDAEEFAERAVFACRLVERAGVFGIVQVQEVDPIDAERLQALLERAARARGVEHARLEIAVELGRDDEALRKTAALANGGADPLLAAPEPIIARSVDEIGGPIENGVDRGSRARFVDAVAIGVRHVAEAGGAKADGRDHKIGAAQSDLVHGALGQSRTPWFVWRRIRKAPARRGQGERALTRRRSGPA